MANNKSTTGRTKKPSTAKKPLKEPIPINSATSSPQTGSNSISADDRPVTQSFPGMEEEIRRRAYELYEERGRQEGFHHEDWARAEAEILGKYSKKEERSA